MISVSVLALTRCRPVLLARCLRSLASQELPATVRLFEVLVLDNDDKQSARDVVSDCQDLLPQLRYLACPVRNLAVIRNRLLDEGRGEFLAFIDDDEEAEPQWLAELVGVAQQHRADIVGGPVLLRPDPDARTGWIDYRRVQLRPRAQTGSQLQPIGSGNMLLRRSFLAREDIRFDERHGTGAEDTAFFALASDKGASFVWADGAVVHETYDEERLSLRYFVSRALRSGWRYAVLQEQRGSSRPAWLLLARILGGTAIAGARGGTTLALLAVRSPRSVNYAMLAARALGRVAHAAALLAAIVRRWCAGGRINSWLAER